jgi:hypothetical protein
MNLFLSYQNIEDNSYYLRYKKLFLKNVNYLSFDEKSFHFSNLVNILVIKRSLNIEGIDHLKEEFGLYNIILENEYYKEGKIVFPHPALFRAILFVSLKLKKFEWVKDFIARYYKKVPEADRINILNFAQAFYYYEKGELNKSSHHIMKITIDRFIYKYDIRNLTLKIFYELNNTEDLIKLIHNYKDFLRYNTFVSPERKKVFGNFVGFVEKLSLFKDGKNNIDLKLIKRQVKGNKFVSNRKCLLEKIDELQNCKK